MAKSRPSSKKHNRLDLIPCALLNTGWMKYVTVRIYRDRHSGTPAKYILRGFRHPDWTEHHFTTADQLPDGPDDYVLNRVKFELDPYGVPYQVIGWGKLFHDLKARTVTFREEDLMLVFDGHSEQSYQARLIIESSRLHAGYVIYHVYSNGHLSPRTRHYIELNFR